MNDEKVLARVSIGPRAWASLVRLWDSEIAMLCDSPSYAVLAENPDGKLFRRDYSPAAFGDGAKDAAAKKFAAVCESLYRFGIL